MYAVIAAVTLLGFDSKGSMMSTSFGTGATTIMMVQAIDPEQQNAVMREQYRGKNKTKYVRYRYPSRDETSSMSSDADDTLEDEEDMGNAAIEDDEEESIASGDTTTMSPPQPPSSWTDFFMEYHPSLLFQHLCRKLSRHRDNPKEKNVGDDATPPVQGHPRPKPNYSGSSSSSTSSSQAEDQDSVMEDFMMTPTNGMTAYNLQFSYPTNYVGSGDDDEDENDGRGDGLIPFPFEDCQGNKECDRETRDV